MKFVGKKITNREERQNDPVFTAKDTSELDYRETDWTIVNWIEVDGNELDYWIIV